MQIYRHIPKSGSHSPCALTIGNYDGIHLGHQDLINELLNKSKNTKLESAIMIFEPHPREFFTPKDAPSRITSLREKIEYFQSKKIDRVYVIKFDKKFSNMSGDNFISILKKQISARAILVGEDFRFGSNREFGINDLLKSNVETTIVKETKKNNKRVSSTQIREASIFWGLNFSKSFTWKRLLYFW